MGVVLNKELGKGMLNSVIIKDDSEFADAVINDYTNYFPIQCCVQRRDSVKSFELQRYALFLNRQNNS